jgi:hypothetical protein
MKPPIRIASPSLLTKKYSDVLIDDEDKSFPIEIEIEYTLDWYGLDVYTTVWSMDYKIEGEPRLTKSEISECVRDIIRSEENYKVTFEY